VAVLQESLTMYIEKKNTELPNETTIWRYMDFMKFVDMLDSAALYFTNAAEFEDVYDCSVIPFWENDGLKIDQRCLKKIELIKQSTFVNCWRIDKDVSDISWRSYLKSDTGVAIKSSIKDLTESFFTPESQNFDVRISKVCYGHENVKRRNTEKEVFNVTDAQIVKAKKKCFAHENEVRAFMTFNEEKKEKGILVKVDLNRLINAVYVSSRSPDWIYSLVKRVSEKYGLKSEVIPSSKYKLTP
jgi:hypothetical protein